MHFRKTTTKSKRAAVLETLQIRKRAATVPDDDLCFSRKPIEKSLLERLPASYTRMAVDAWNSILNFITGGRDPNAELQQV